MILPAQTIRRLGLVQPFHERTVHECGMSFGLSSAGYDIRIRETLVLKPNDFSLASTVERFYMPNDIMPMIKDKSTWARLGISVFNTVGEPGWRGVLTLEIKNQGHEIIHIPSGAPIAQMIFCRLEEPTEQPYSGKYQNQEARPVEARFER